MPGLEFLDVLVARQPRNRLLTHAVRQEDDGRLARLTDKGRCRPQVEPLHPLVADGVA